MVEYDKKRVKKYIRYDYQIDRASFTSTTSLLILDGSSSYKLFC